MPSSPRSLSAPKMRQLRNMLADGREHSSWEITRTLRTVDPTIVRELRAHGYDVPCRHSGSAAWYRYSTADLERHIAGERRRLQEELATINTLEESQP